MSEAQVGGGRIELEIDGKIGYLEPSLEACIEISKFAGGLSGALDRCQRMHFETICEIIATGLVVNGQKLGGRHKADLLPKAVYEAGVMDVAAKAMEFVHIVSRGGRPVEDEDEDDESGEGSDEAPLG